MSQKQSKSSSGKKQPDAERKGSTTATKSKTQTDASSKREINLTQRLADSMPPPKPESKPAGKATLSGADKPTRRTARPARGRIAANDDLPSIGGLIFSLQQRPARTPFYVAAGASIVWVLLCLGGGALLFDDRLSALSGGGDMLRDPAVLTLGATLFVPVALFWFLALLIWRAQELRLMASAMTEVAVRLAEPDKMATQSVASLGQTIRRQVAAMNDAISRALGRAGELEALVHNEVATLERSYSENELRIKGLIEGLASERDALANNSERVSKSLRGIGTQVARDITDASDQVTKSLANATSELAAGLNARGGKITEAVSAAGAAIDNKLAQRGTQITQQLTSQGDLTVKTLETAGANVSAALTATSDLAVNKLDTAGANVSVALKATGDLAVKKLDTTGANVSAALKATSDLAVNKLDTTGANVSAALKATTDKATNIVDVKSNALMKSLTAVSEQLVKDIPGLLERLDGEQKRLSTIISGANQNFSELENAIAKRTTQLDGSLRVRAEEMKTVLAERTTQLDGSLKTHTEQLKTVLAHHTAQLDGSFNARAEEMKTTLSERINALDDTMRQQAKFIESTLSTNTMAMSQIFAEGADTLKKTTGHMARQSSQASDNLSTQAVSLKDVSHNLIAQVHGLIQRFDAQSKAVVTASQALDSSNALLDATLQRRHAEISKLLETVSTKAQNLDEMMRSYSGIIDGSLVQIEKRAKQVTVSLAKETTAQTTITLAEIERLRTEARQHTEHTVSEISGRFQSISDQIADKLGNLSALTGASAGGNGVGAPQLPPAYTTAQPGSSFTGQAPPPEGYPAPAASAATPASSGMASVTANLASRLGKAAQAPGQTASPQHPAADQSRVSGLGVNMRNNTDSAQRDQWSVGDLLARASGPDQGAHTAPPAPPSPAGIYNAPAAGTGNELRLNDIASAIDQNTASTIWQRFRSGERGVFNRQLYTPNGQVTFDEISGRFKREPAFRTTVERYIADFESLLSDAERKGQNNQMIDNYLTSETGRVYLILAHVSGRLK